MNPLDADLFLSVHIAHLHGVITIFMEMFENGFGMGLHDIRWDLGWRLVEMLVC